MLNFKEKRFFLWFFRLYFPIYNLHATTSTLLPEQSPKYPQFTAPLASKHSDSPRFLTSLLSHPIHCPQLTPAPCIKHFFSLFSFSLFFVILRKFNVFFLSGLSVLFVFFCLALVDNFLSLFFCFLFFLSFNMQDFSERTNFCERNWCVELCWREGVRLILGCDSR